MASIFKIKHNTKSVDVRPIMAMVFHGVNEQNIACSTIHTVKSNNQLSVGQVANTKRLKALFDNLIEDKDRYSEATELFSDALLFDSDNEIIWYRKRFHKKIWFRVGKGIQSFFVEWPALLYKANKKSKSLQVFALSSNSRPTPNTRLYHAPLMNINSFGVLCQGTAVLPKDINVSTIADCESSLIDSQFTHINHTNTLRNGANNTELISFWQSKENNQHPKRVLASEMCLWGKMAQLLNGGK